MKESLKKEYDALGLPIDRLPNIASNEQEEFFVLACNSHHALVDQVERLRESAQETINAWHGGTMNDVRQAMIDLEKALKETEPTK